MRVSIITLTVNLACRPMEKMEKWPHPTMDHSDQFEFDHFVRAFDIAFGNIRTRLGGRVNIGSVCRVSKYIGGGSYGRVFLAYEQVTSSKLSTKRCKWAREFVAYLRGGARLARPEGKSVAIKFLPAKSKMTEVDIGCLAYRENQRHLGK